MTNKEWLFNKPNSYIAGCLTAWDMNKEKWVTLNNKEFDHYTDAVRYTVKWLDTEMKMDQIKEVVE